MFEKTVSSEYIDYQLDGQIYKGYLVYPTGSDPRPGVLVVHEWWGQGDNIRRRAEMLAAEGYAAFAVDLYGDGKQAEDPDQATEYMNALLGEQDAVLKRFQAAMDVMNNNPHVESEKLAAMGYCMGGAVVLNMARAGLDLFGVASFHGLLETDSPAEAGKVLAQVRAFHGNDDAMVTPEHVAAFKAEMENAGVSYEFVGYDSAPHGFTNPEADVKAEKYGAPVGYNAAADQDSWNQTLVFFREIFS